MPASSAFPPVSESIILLSQQLDAWKSDGSGQTTVPALRANSLRLAEQLLNAEKLSKSDASVMAILALSLQLHESGGTDAAPSPEALAFLKANQGNGWLKLAACLLVAPPWQWPQAPALDTLPLWMLPAYARICLCAPRSFHAPGQAAAYARFNAQFYSQLARLTQANPGASVTRSILDQLLLVKGDPLALNTGESLRHLVEGRATALKHALRIPRQDPIPAFPLEGRRLKVGFVVHHHDSGVGSLSLLPLFEFLDQDSYEVIHFTCSQTMDPMEEYIRALNHSLEQLPPDIDSQVLSLRSRMLDVLVLACDPALDCDEVARLGFHRSAPLQLVTGAAAISSGLPEIDAYLTGTLVAGPGSEGEFAERLSLLPGLGLGYNGHVQTIDYSFEPSRAALGIPEDAFLYVSGAPITSLIPEVIETWAVLLARQPNTCLLLHPAGVEQLDPRALSDFCAGFISVLASQGVDSKRLVVSANQIQDRREIIRLLSLGNLYLDTFPRSEGVPLLGILAAGIPVVTLEGQRPHARTGAACLREFGMTEGITTDLSGYAALAESVVTQPEQLARLQSQVAASLAQGCHALDGVAIAEEFGTLIRSCHEELCRVGTNASFRSKRTPLVAPAAPMGERGHVDAATALIAQGQFERAIVHLMSAIEATDASGETWFLLAQTLRQAGKLSEAVTALETALRKAPRHLEAWLMLVEITEQLGVADMAADSVKILRDLAPEDPRVLALAARYPSH